MFFLVGAAVHYRPGVALGFGSGSVVSPATNTKTHCNTGWVVNPTPTVPKTGEKSKTAPLKSVAIKTEADPLFCVSCRRF